ncbi:DsbA family protein [Bacteroidota bacterium]
MRDRFIYVFDPLCSWCYGFHPTVRKIYEENSDSCEIEVLCGGNFIGEEKMPVKNRSLKIQRAYEGVGRITGAEFSRYFFDNIIHNHQYIMDSEPSCIAFYVMKTILPEKALSISYSLQQCFYIEGRRLDKQATFTALARKYGISKQDFLDKFLDSKYKELTFQEFDRVKEIDVHGYPSFFLLKNGKYHDLAEGFAKEEEVRKELSRIL